MDLASFYGVIALMGVVAGVTDPAVMA